MTLEQLIGDLKNFITEHPNLTKAEVAEKCGVTHSGLCNILKRTANPSGIQVLKIQELTAKDLGLQSVNAAFEEKIKRGMKNIVKRQGTKF